MRNELVAEGFTSPFGLQARQWKLALDDALFTLERQWEVAVVEVKERLYRHEGPTTKRNKKYRSRCENEINRAFNEFYQERRPKVIAYEDLAHLRGKTKNKGLSRKVSNWQRSIIKRRREYKNYIFSVADPGPVNAAYSSQECPQCGWLETKNRSGDTFKCRKCGFTADADHVAAMNLKKRLHDEKITRYMPYKKVKEILLQRYQQKQA